jgi:neutral/alkaline ceramidase-like enzyme
VAVAAGLWAPAGASAGTLKAGVAKVDASWHVGASAGQYASDGTFVSPDDGSYDPTVDSYRRRASYGIQSRLDVRAIVVEGPDGNRFALVKNDFYIPQDLIWRRTAQLLEAKPELKIGKSNLTMAITHDHSSPFYASTAWGVWSFQDVFDVRFYNYYAARMAEAVEKAAKNLVPVRVGASVRQFDKTHRHSFGTARADDGTPAGYPVDNTDHDLTVVRFDDISNAARPKPLANIVNFGLHGEFLDGNDLVSADFVGPLEKYADDATGALTIWTQNAVGTSEPERSTYHSIHERDEFTHHEYKQAEYGASLMSTAIAATWQDIGSGTPEDPAKYAPFRSAFTGSEVAMRDQWFPGPISHPYPGVSSCHTNSALAGDPRLPIVGLPDCEGVQGGLNDLAGLIGLPGPGNLPISPIDPGLTTADFERLGVPVPENYSAPAYTGLEEDIDVHLQAMRIGDILFTVCSCEQWFDQSKNIKTRTDRVAANEYLGWDWKNGTGALVEGGQLETAQSPPPPCSKNNDGSYGGGSPGYGTGTWKCPAPADPSANLPDKDVEHMHRQVVNPANGWNNFENATQAESESADLTKLKGNYTHDDSCKQLLPLPGLDEPENDFWNKPCAPGEKSPSADLGYKLTVPISMANDYNGYIATYREYQRGDHYRKALTGWGAHSSDYFASRLVNLGRVLNGGDPAKLLPSELFDSKIPIDLVHNDQRAQALGEEGTKATQAYEAQLPDDGGTPAAVKQPPDIQRFDGTFFTWNGGSNYTDNPQVKVQRKVGSAWSDYDGQSSELPVTIEYPQGQDTPSYETGSFEWHWTAHYEAFASGGGAKPFDALERNRSTPAGSYRFLVDGERREGGRVVPYHVESSTFLVKPWTGVTVEDLKLEADRKVSFRVGPRSTRPDGSLTAEIGPIDYPDTYDYGPGGPLPKFITKDWRALRDPAAPNDPTKFEWFCDECSFRPWLDSGDASQATVTFVSPTGHVHRVPARPKGDRWISDRAIGTATAVVGEGCVRDAFGDFNGQPSQPLGSGTPSPSAVKCAH